ncbi:reverse transcriptase domain-containing protein [Caerostris extrusa]|uniref:Reverse transcriptase domain-containing protein n=1 Tax=Caerostris extrusa TaxID=172846 RepID=A0AAV4SGP8_CAEEX|nr:reverse transcriptase domain-containing protein [Caerostris extrusa]
MDKTNFCVFSTDRKHRGTFNSNTKINDSPIKKIDLTFIPTYLITMDPEFPFTRHIVHIANKALRKLSILKNLRGTTWGSRPKTVKNAFCSIIRPLLEYAAPIWNPNSQPSKMDSVQHRASKIIIGAVSSTDNNKAEQEWGLPLLENRRNLATIKFTNRLRSKNMDHISTRVFNEWKRLNKTQKILNSTA